jgi:hypothetical protein
MTDHTTWTGLLLIARDGSEQVEAFIGRKVMDVWAGSVERRGERQSLFRSQYNAVGKLNLAAIQRIVNAKYQRGVAFNRQHPSVEILSRTSRKVTRPWI